MPEMPKGSKEGIIQGMYKFKVSNSKSKIKAHLLGSGSILNETLKAQEILAKDYGVSADVWSVTSYKNLHYDALETDRWNRLNHEKEPRKAYVQKITEGEEGVFISASDYSQILADAISKWLPGKLTTLGTLGFGRSESREALRDFFEVDAKHIVYTTLYALFEEGKVKNDLLKKALKDLKINVKKSNPINS